MSNPPLKTSWKYMHENEETSFVDLVIIRRNKEASVFTRFENQKGSGSKPVQYGSRKGNGRKPVQYGSRNLLFGSKLLAQI